MMALGLQGSPRKNGNSDILLNGFMDELAGLGAHTTIVDVTRHQIEPCKEISVCETSGFCPIKDDMAAEIYPLLREADIIVLASPIFFYGLTAQIKAVIDRSQALWARRYRLRLKDPRHDSRRGFFLGVGATRGAKLFDGALLTVKYFFDGVAARHCGQLTYPGVEKRSQISTVPGLRQDLARAAAALTDGLRQRRRILFVDDCHDGRSRMAAAFAMHHGGEQLDAHGSDSRLPPAGDQQGLLDVMQEKGIDLAHHRPVALTDMIDRHRPQEIICLGSAPEVSAICGRADRQWDFADPTDGSIEALRALRDRIESKVIEFICNPE